MLELENKRRRKIFFFLRRATEIPTENFFIIIFSLRFLTETKTNFLPLISDYFKSFRRNKKIQ